MLLYFSSRSKARQSIPAAKLVDNGQSAPAGKRYARDISGLSKLTRKALRNKQGNIVVDHLFALFGMTVVILLSFIFVHFIGKLC